MDRKELFLHAMKTMREAVEIMALEAQVAEEFLAMPEVYQAGWLDAMKIVQDVLLTSATKIEEIL